MTKKPISPEEFNKEDFNKWRENYQPESKRDPIYVTAIFLVKNFWGEPIRMADGLGVLLQTWNKAFYNFGMFDYDELAQCISKNLSPLNKYRQRDIQDYLPTEDSKIAKLFQEFLDALKRKNDDRKSPVGVAKALHILAPAFFPIWDNEIAKAYGCVYNKVNSADKYIAFMLKTQQIANELRADVKPEGTEKTLLKLIDEYNYAKYTMK